MSNPVTLKGGPVEIGGIFPQKGQTAPNFSLADKARAAIPVAMRMPRNRRENRDRRRTAGHGR